MSEPLAKLLKPNLQIVTVLWMAFLASVFTQTFLVYTTSAANPVSAQATLLVLSDSFSTVIICAAAFILALFFIAPKQLLRLQLKKLPEHAVSVESARLLKSPHGVNIWNEEKLRQMSTLTKDELFSVLFFQHWFASFIIKIALAESICILGMVRAFNAKQFGVLLPFAAAALALILISRPTMENYIRQVKELRNGNI